MLCFVSLVLVFFCVEAERGTVCECDEVSSLCVGWHWQWRLAWRAVPVLALSYSLYLPKHPSMHITLSLSYV